MTALRTSVLGCAALAALLLLAPIARAEAPKPTWIGAIPVGFEYTHDPKDPDPKEGSTSGIRIHYLTPWYVGVGINTFKSSLLDKGGYASILSGDLETSYTLYEVSLNYQLGPVILGYGYGSGKIQYSPKSQTVSGVTIKRNDSDVVEHFFNIGVMIGANWSVQGSWHAVVAEVDQDFSVGGVSAGSKTGDLGAIVTMLGVGYTF